MQSSSQITITNIPTFFVTGMVPFLSFSQQSHMNSALPVIVEPLRARLPIHTVRHSYYLRQVSKYVCLFVSRIMQKLRYSTVFHKIRWNGEGKGKGKGAYT